MANYTLSAAHFIRWFAVSIRSELVASVNPANTLLENMLQFVDVSLQCEELQEAFAAWLFLQSCDVWMLPFVYSLHHKTRDRAAGKCAV